LSTRYGRNKGDVFDALARLRPPLILMILLLLTGTTGFMAIDGFPFLDAMYMTVISVATVGFGEIYPLSQGGRLFTMALIMGGFAVFTYSVGVFVEVITRRDLFGLIRIKGMENRIKTLSGHYIVVGYTPIAQELILVFKRRGIDFVVIESEQARLRQIKQDGVGLFLPGNYYDNDVYRRAGISAARGIVSNFKNDADNITVVVTGRIFEEATGRDLFIISTCTDAQSKARLEKVGADYVISPDTLIGHRISALAIRPPEMGSQSILERVAFGEYSELDIREVRIKEGSAVATKALMETNMRKLTGAYVVAIKRTGRKIRINPDPEDRLRVGDTLMVVGSSRQLLRFEEFIRPDGTYRPDETTPTDTVGN